MLKVGGIWVSPVEVENTLVGHGAVLEAAVVGHGDTLLCKDYFDSTLPTGKILSSNEVRARSLNPRTSPRAMRRRNAPVVQCGGLPHCSSRSVILLFPPGSVIVTTPEARNPPPMMAAASPVPIRMRTRLMYAELSASAISGGIFEITLTSAPQAPAATNPRMTSPDTNRYTANASVPNSAANR